jgi:hypothetical protein
VEYCEALLVYITHLGWCLLCLQMCPAIDAVLEYVNKKWAKLTGEDILLPHRMLD